MHLDLFMRLRGLLAIIVPAILLAGCFGEGDGQAKISADVPPPPDDFVLVFEDEFDVDGAPSAANWTIETGYGPNNDGNGNNEWQLYTDSSDNVRVEGGNLVISALCPTPPCGVRNGTITSGKLTTLDKFDFRYGRVEARIKPPVGKAAWPAFWALGANHPVIGWPRSGEIDFMEMHNFFSNERTTHFTMHWCDQTLQAPDECSFPEGWIFDTENFEFNFSLGDDFHIFEAEWDANKIVGKIDGVAYFTRTIEPGTMEEFRRAFYMILNVAMGGTLGSGGQAPNGAEVFPQTMLVDYVRVYQRERDIDTGEFLIDFEDDGAPYVFNDFEGGVGFVTDNPDMNGNTSPKVARLIKFAGGTGELFAGTMLESDPFDVPLGSSFTMKAWSAREGPINILFKLEGGPAAELEVSHPGGGWREFTLDFPGISGTYSGFTFILDLGTPGADPSNSEDPAWNVYIDDILLIPGEDTGGGNPVDDSVIDFEPAGGPYTFNDFEGGVGFVTENPDMNGNTSANVAALLKFAGGQNFAGTTLDLNTPWDTADGTTFTAKVWGNRPDLSGVALTFKLEGAGQEVVVTHGNTGWEELTFELPAASGTITGITFILDNGVPGADPSNTDDPNWTIYIDDITQVPDDGGGDPGVDDSVIDFEPAGGPYTFNDFEGGVGFVTENPDMNGNTSANVAALLKFAGGQNFAGTTLDLNTPWDTADGTTFTAKVWGNRPDLSGVALTFKLEGAGQEVVVTHGNTGWEELTFELPAASGTITGITFILDNGVPGADPSNTDDPNWTIYIDDITQVPDDGGGDPGVDDSVIDFEPAGGPYTFNDFEGGVGFVTENPDMNGNTSANVAALLKFAGGQNFAGTTLDLNTPWDTADGTTFTAKVWGNRPDLSGVALTFKLEGAGAEVVVTHGNTGWEELTFELPAASGTITGITFILDNGVPGADPSNTDDPNWTIYIDDITQVPDDGGGDPGVDDSVIDFEPAGGPYTFNDFEGGVGFVTENPDMNGNTSANVAALLKFAGGQNFAGTTLDLNTPWDTADGTTFTAKVWGNRPDLSGVALTFKLEGAGQEVVVTHGNTGWEELTFELPAASGTITGITFILDNGVPGATPTDPPSEDPNWTIYIDDITQVPDDGGGDPGGDAPVLVSDFEAGGGPYVFTDFEGGSAFVTANPDPTGINTSDSVGQMQKFAGAVFAGSTLELAAGLEVTAGSTITMKVWASRPVPVLLKLEGDPDVEASAMHGGTGWEELTFDLTSASGSYTGITLIFDLGIAGDAANDPDNWTFYFDDITLVPPGGGGDPGGGDPPVLISDFEAGGGPYLFSDFEGGVGSIVANPDPTGINTSDSVGQMQKFAGAVFAGSTLELASGLEVTAGSTFTMKVWASRPVPVLLKLEGDPDVEASAMHGGTGWEELTFDLTSASSSYTGITLIFDLGVAGDAENDPDNWTFYFDDITLVPPGGGGDPGGDPVLISDFEAGGGPYLFNDFEGGVGSIVANPDPTGINTSDSVGQMQKFAGAVFAGSTLELASGLEVTAGSTFTMKVWASRPVPVLLKLEGDPDVEASAMHGGTGWEELTFDLTSASSSYTGITLIFDLGIAGDAANDPDNWTFYFDDITLIPSGGSR